MTLSQFEALIGRFGPVVDSWPPALIPDALDLLQASAAAQDLFARASLDEAEDVENDGPRFRFTPPPTAYRL